MQSVVSFNTHPVENRVTVKCGNIRPSTATDYHEKFTYKGTVLIDCYN